TGVQTCALPILNSVATLESGTPGQGSIGKRGQVAVPPDRTKSPILQHYLTFQVQCPSLSRNKKRRNDTYYEKSKYHEHSSIVEHCSRFAGIASECRGKRR